MKPREVVFAPEAEDDLERLFDWIAERAGPTVADVYLDRLEILCLGFDLASERGIRRDDIREGIRITGFEQRVTVAFVV